MTGWPFWIFILTLLVLHFLLHLALGLAEAAPDLMTVALLLSARRVNRAAAAGLGALLGILRDALAAVAFGADAVTMTVTGYLGARTRDFFVGDSTLFVVVYLFLGKWLHDIAYYLLRGIGGGTGAPDSVAVYLLAAPLAAAYAAAAGTVALAVYRWLNE